MTTTPEPPMCVHEDGTEHPAVMGADGMYTTCDVVEEVEPTIEGAAARIAIAVELLDNAGTQLAELLDADRERRTEALDFVWQAWAYAERARGLLVPVPGT